MPGSGSDDRQHLSVLSSLLQILFPSQVLHIGAAVGDGDAHIDHFLFGIRFALGFQFPAEHFGLASPEGCFFLSPAVGLDEHLYQLILRL